jgi:hypothetical protein
VRRSPRHAAHKQIIALARSRLVRHHLLVEITAVPDLPLTSPEPLDPAAVARVERMLDLAPLVADISPEDLARVQRRLVASEHERWHGDPPQERAEELDRLIARGVETLCAAIKMLARAIEHMPSA